MKIPNIEVSQVQLTDFCQQWQIQELALFGSVLREDFSPETSDVDILVSFMPDSRWTIFDHVQMQEELEVIFSRKVDLVSRRAIEHSHNRFRRSSILKSAEVIYARA